MTTYEALRAQLATLKADRDARALAADAARRAASGDDAISQAEAQLNDPVVLEEHAAAEEAWAMGELLAIGDEDAPLTARVEQARVELAAAELGRQRGRHELRHEDRRREVDRRRAEAVRLRDQAAPGVAVGDPATLAVTTVQVAPVAGDGVIVTRALVAGAGR